MHSYSQARDLAGPEETRRRRRRLSRRAAVAAAAAAALSLAGLSAAGPPGALAAHHRTAALPMTAGLASHGVVRDWNVSASGTGSATTASGGAAAAGDVLVAYVEADAPGAGSQTATVSGCGQAWSLLGRENAQAGDAEAWTATVASAQASCAVTAKLGQAGYQLSVTAADYGAAGVPAATAAHASSGAAAVTVASVPSGSALWLAGDDWDTATARTLLAGDSMVHQDLASVGDTYWTEQASGPASGTVTIGTSAPSGDQWNAVAVVIPPASPTSPSPSPTSTSPSPSPSPTSTSPSPSPTSTSPSPSSGFPDASTTGPGVACSSLPAASSPNPTGQGNSYVTNVTADGTVISNLNLTGSLDVYANNVTVQNVCITTKNWWGINLRAGFTGLKVLHVTIAGVPGQGLDNGGEDYGVSSAGGSVEVGYSDVSEVGDALSMGTGYLHDNYVHALQSYIPLCGSGPCSYYQHTDDVISDGGSGLDIEHNTLLNQMDPAHGASASVGLFADSGAVTNATVNNNFMAGGAYCLYPGGGSTSSGIVITNNQFSTRFWSGCGYYGPDATSYWHTGAGNTWSGNTWADGPNAGQPVNP